MCILLPIQTHQFIYFPPPSVNSEKKFCRKCIYDKLTEESDCCPVCNIDLGCSAVERLRPDHNLQDVMAKIFPLKRRKVNAPEVVSSVPLPTRRKEGSLSSLVVSTPRVSTQTGLTGRRTKAIARMVGSSVASMSTSARKRLMRDFKRLQQDRLAGISGAPQDNNIML